MQGRRWLEFVLYNLAAIALGIAAGFATVLYVGGNLELALSSFFLFPISTTYNIAEIFVRFIALYTIGLGIGLALKAGLWNIGGEGQFLIGSIMTFVGAIYIQGIPSPLHVIVMLLLGALSGLAWIVVPTILRVKYGANEIVVTLLLNIVAASLALYALDGPIRGRQSAGYLITDPLPQQLSLEAIIPGTRLSYALFITLGIAAVMYFMIEKTPFGLRISIVGESTEAALYAGINITKVYVIVMLVAGALAGLAGAMHTMGVLKRLDSGSIQPGFGYLAIIVAMLGRKNMLGIGVASLLFSYVIVGAETMAQIASLPTPVVYAMEGIMLVGVTLSTYLIGRGK